MSLRENIKEAEGSWNPFWFRDQVDTGGPWDYKQQDPKYQDFGNFHYGATGAAMGWPDNILKRLAGRNHMGGPSARREFGHWLKGAPYGDDPRDQEMIQKGIDFYNSRKR